MMNLLTLLKNKEIPGTRDDTLYVTYVSDPVERIQNEYHYHGKWDCTKLIDAESKGSLFSLSKQQIQQSFQQYSNIIDWLSTTTTTTKTKGEEASCNNQQQPWSCHENCYTRWFGQQQQQQQQQQLSIIIRYIR